MHKSLLISVVIVIFFGILLYLSHQQYLDLQELKESQIKSLSAEIEWKDRMISNLTRQLKEKNSSPSNATSAEILDSETDSSDTITGTSTRTLSPSARQIEQSRQINILSEKLERQTTTLRNLSRLKPFSRIQMTNDDLAGYFDRMAEISQQNLYNSEFLVNPDRYGQVKFDNSDYIPDQSKNSFDTDNSRLYAHFDLPDYPHQTVLIKWYKQGVSEPIELSYFDINPHSSENYAWIEPGSDWDEGRYFVEIYSASESAEMLSAGSYTVE